MASTPVIAEKIGQIAVRGRGRPVGTMTKETKLRMKSTATMQRRIYRIADKIIGAQIVSALGSYKIVVKSVLDGIISFETVRDEKRMQELLDNGIHGEDYLIVAGAIPDWKAGNALLDRGFGKAKESLELSGDVSFSLRALAQRRLAEQKDQEVLTDAETVPE